MQGVSVVFIICCMVGIAAAAEDVCNVIAPDITLNEAFSRCRHNTQSCSSDCVAAMHRFCQKVTYPTAMKTFGVSREHKKNVIGMSCVRSKSMSRVNIRTLWRYHRGCNKVTKTNIVTVLQFTAIAWRGLVVMLLELAKKSLHELNSMLLAFVLLRNNTYHYVS